MSVATLAPKTRRARLDRPRAIVLGAILFLALFGLETALLPSVPRQPASAAPAPAAIDPRLILRPRTVRIAAALPGGVTLTGTLYPAMPGPNTLRLLVRGPSKAPLPSGRVGLLAAMPGMVMAPVRATLYPRGRGYSGVLALPMFGRYQARAVVETPAHRYAATLTIALTLPRL